MLLLVFLYFCGGIDKFNYLNSFLCDSVSATIRSLSLTSENYHQAIEMLEERYANQQILISAHMQKFVSLPSVKNQHYNAGLRKLFDQVESSVRNLKHKIHYPSKLIQLNGNVKIG